MRKFLIIPFLALLISCGDEAEIGDIFQNLQINPSEVAADGKSTLNVSVEINQKSSSDRRKIIFKTSSGTFTSSGSSSATVEAKYENGILTAKAVLKAGTKAGEVKISVEPEFDSPIKEFVESRSINLLPSIPSSLELEPSSYGLASNFLGETKISGYLKNSSGNFVSEGYSVTFSDFLLDGTPAGGLFRDVHLKTADSSKVSCIYSTKAYPVGTKIKIIGTVADSNISNNLILTINE